MNVIHRRGWEISDRLATPEHFVFNRRSFVAAGVSALTLSPLGATAQRLSDVAKLPDPSADLYPAKRNEKPSRPCDHQRESQRQLQQLL
jgi:methionine sulfoxide reductase catalytic subunit